MEPPENDNEANQLSKKIKKWKNNGKPSPGEKIDKIPKSESAELSSNNDEKQKPDKEEEKSKKKRGRFGFFRK